MGNDAGVVIGEEGGCPSQVSLRTLVNLNNPSRRPETRTLSVGLELKSTSLNHSTKENRENPILELTSYVGAIN